MTALELVKLSPLMARTTGRPEVMVGLTDGPVAIGHADLENENIRELPEVKGSSCAISSSAACKHGTFVAGILAAKRGSPAPAICPGCTLLVRPIFRETNAGNGDMPSATPQELAAAIVETIDAGARILNLSAALAQPSGGLNFRLRLPPSYCCRCEEREGRAAWESYPLCWTRGRLTCACLPEIHHKQ
jgi:subtilisin family serine protease